MGVNWSTTTMSRGFAVLVVLLLIWMIGAFRNMMHRRYHFFIKHSRLYQIYRDGVCNAGWKYFSNCNTSYTAMLLNARAIFDGSVKSVLPQSMVKNALKVKEDKLYVEQTEYTLHQNVHVLAFGKAVIGMVRATEDQLGQHICGGVALVPRGIVKQFQNLNKWDLLPSAQSRVKLYEGAKNNLPDEAAHDAALQIYNHAKSLTADDIALVLISGGGSALLPTPVPPVTISDLNHVTKVLASHGATIEEINTVRKQIEILKGGGLAAVASPAQVISLVLSDVIGDPLSFIASGPTTPDITTPQMCIDLFTRLKITEKVPQTVYQVLEQGKKSLMHNYPDISPSPIQATDFTNVQNVIIGSNTIACENAMKVADSLNYTSCVLSTTLSGDVSVCGQGFANLTNCMLRLHLDQSTPHTKTFSRGHLSQVLTTLAIDESAVDTLQSLVKQSLSNGKRGICLIGAGETTVNVKGQGRGGRNQEMALYWASRMASIIQNNPDLGQRFRIAFLSAGTDGQDGPCEAAGAAVIPEMVNIGRRQGLDPEEFLRDNDSYNYFSQLNDGEFHVVTALTGTNVMDIQVLLIEAVSDI